MVIEVVTLARGMLSKSTFHSASELMATPHLPTSPSRARDRSRSHEGWQVKSRGQSGLALSQEIAKALVGVFAGAEARELAHGPEAAAVAWRNECRGCKEARQEAEVAVRIPNGAKSALVYSLRIGCRKSW